MHAILSRDQRFGNHSLLAQSHESTYFNSKTQRQLSIESFSDWISDHLFGTVILGSNWKMAHIPVVRQAASGMMVLSLGSEWSICIIIYWWVLVSALRKRTRVSLTRYSDRCPERWPIPTYASVWTCSHLSLVCESWFQQLKLSQTEANIFSLRAVLCMCTSRIFTGDSHDTSRGWERNEISELKASRKNNYSKKIFMRHRFYQAEPIELRSIWITGFIKNDRSQIAGYPSHELQTEIVLAPIIFINDSLARRLCLNPSREATEGLTREIAMELFQYELLKNLLFSDSLTSFLLYLEQPQNQAFWSLNDHYRLYILIVSVGLLGTDIPNHVLGDVLQSLVFASQWSAIDHSSHRWQIENCGTLKEANLLRRAAFSTNTFSETVPETAFTVSPSTPARPRREWWKSIDSGNFAGREFHLWLHPNNIHICSSTIVILKVYTRNAAIDYRQLQLVHSAIGISTTFIPVGSRAASFCFYAMTVSYSQISINAFTASPDGRWRVEVQVDNGNWRQVPLGRKWARSDLKIFIQRTWLGTDIR